MLRTGASGTQATTSTRSWFDAVTGWVDLPARILMSVMFLFSGVGKLAASAATESLMRSQGLPGFLVWPSAFWEIAAGVLLLVGWMVRPVALLLAGWCLLTALIFHTALGDPNQVIHLLKNVTLAGTFMMLAKSGSWSLSIDGIGPRRHQLPA